MSILNIIRQTNKPIAKQSDSIRTNGLSLLLSMIFIGLCYTTHVQAVTYANASTPYNWIDASSHFKLGPLGSTNSAYTSVHAFYNAVGCGTPLPSIDDDITDPIDIGFTFMYSGINFTQLRIMSNGRLQFGSTNATCGYGTPVTQILYPDASLNYSMRIYGGDLDPSLQSDIGTASGYITPCTSRSTCYVSYMTLGTAPYRQFVVTWNNVPEWTSYSGPSGNISLQMILQENGEFIYQYGGYTAHNTAGYSYALDSAASQKGWQADIIDYDIPSIGFPPSNTAIKFYIPRPVAEYRMEQPSWNGIANEVYDTSGNGRHGVAVGAAQTTASGYSCRGAAFPANTSAATDAINTKINIPTTVGGVGTMTFWYHPSQWVGSSSDAQLVDASVSASSTNNQWFYLQKHSIDSSHSTLKFVIDDGTTTTRVAETGNLTSTTPVAGWVHIAVSWNFNALAADKSDHMRIYVNGLQQNVYVNGVQQNESSFTSSGTVLPASGTQYPLYLGDNGLSDTSPNGTGNSANGVIDEFRIYNYEGGIALVQRDMLQAATACLSSYAVTNNSSGSVCQVNNVTVTAKDGNNGSGNNIIMPNNTTTITLKTSTGQGDWTLISGYGVLNNGTANDGIATYLFNGEYQAVFGLTDLNAGSVSINVTDGQIAGNVSTTSLASCTGQFGCLETSITPYSTSTAKLYTKLVGTSFNVDVVASDTSGVQNINYVPSGSNTPKTVTVDLVDGNGATACASRTSRVSAISAVFAPYNTTNPGRTTTNTMTVNQAYSNLLCRVTDNNQSPAIVSCSVDAFSVRPGAVTMATSANAASLSVSATPTIKAGNNFTTSATTSTSATDTYAGVLSVDTSKLTVQATGALGSLTSFKPDNTVLTPTAVLANSTTTMSYSDVGYVSASAGAFRDDSFTSIDQPNDCISSIGADANLAVSLSGNKYGCSIGNQSAISFGRFIPDHFVLTPSAATPGCGVFTYFGQDGFKTGFTLSALNSSGGPTNNYAGSWSRLPLTTWGAYPATSGSPGYGFAASSWSPSQPIGANLAASATVPSGTWVNGSATVMAKHQVSLPTTSTLPTKLNVTAIPVDADGVTLLNGAATTIATGMPFYSGRIALQNASGSELLDLAMPMTAQYWNGTAWVTNTDDACTTGLGLNGANVGATTTLTNLYAYDIGTLVHSGSIGTVNDITANRFSQPPSAGNFNLNFQAPGSGHTGAMGITATNVPSYLQYNWTGLGNAGPSANATFGIYTGNKNFIYLRELY